MEKDDVLRRFPIGCTVRPKDGVPFGGRMMHGTVIGARKYLVAFLGERWRIEVSDEAGRLLGDYRMSDLEVVKR